MRLSKGATFTNQNLLISYVYLIKNYVMHVYVSYSLYEDSCISLCVDSLIHLLQKTGQFVFSWNNTLSTVLMAWNKTSFLRVSHWVLKVIRKHAPWIYTHTYIYILIVNFLDAIYFETLLPVSNHNIELSHGLYVKKLLIYILSC